MWIVILYDHEDAVEETYGPFKTYDEAKHYALIRDCSYDIFELLEPL